jgi:NAD(P)-dependent dehydrogenase (short-subunit alcohol dehydrogenase family)
VLDINTLGPMRVSEALIEHVARSDRKLIVTVTSGMGSLADNTSGGWIAYRTSKAAVNMAMRSLAIDLAPRGISCVVVNPGWVRTDMGGPTATLSPQESITAMKRLIERLGPNQSGKFFNYDGREYPWWVSFKADSVQYRLRRENTKDVDVTVILDRLSIR